MAQPGISIQHLGGGAAEELKLHLQGFDELERRLKALPRKIENKCLRKALSTAGRRVAKKLRAGTPVGATGRAQKSVKMKGRGRGADTFSEPGFPPPPPPAAAYALVKYTRLGWSGHAGKKDPGPPLYMRIFEQGSSRQPARPYLAAALGN